MMYWLIAVIALGLIIFVHELGHFLVGKRKGIPIKTFSLGFGPRLLGFEWKETDYRISLIPLGGYVLPKLDSIKDLHKIPIGRRVAFSLGGPMANIFFAVILISIYNSISSGPSLINTLLFPPVQTASITLSILVGFGSLFTDPGSMSGIIGMASQGGSFVSVGPMYILLFMVIININLAVFNMLPIPVLDGGKIMMTLLEKVSIRTRKAQIPITVASLFLILGLMLYTTLLDIIHLVNGSLITSMIPP